MSQSRLLSGPSVGIRSRLVTEGQAQSQGLTLGSAAHSSPEQSRRHDSSPVPGVAPSHLRLRQDKIRPLTAGAPFRSAPELLGPRLPRTCHFLFSVAHRMQVVVWLVFSTGRASPSHSSGAYSRV
ncbi:hypothetical protein NDU88_006855 [Pleurodeles waltl]|uniref:Uncharacterized protein n=1 Tax=Pleurodeles waltl TaxID=8319 RepID=A0AAV7VN29_PLEWA|nr:hypothetical protein NDU88_006855 [Pleurodeles waltl]